MESFARDFVRDAIGLHKKSHALIFALSGNLGSGKTAFVRGAAESLKAKGAVTSPTFIIVRRLSLKEADEYNNLFHVDLYRIKTVEELKQLELEDAMRNHRNIIFIEWPEKAEYIIPPGSFLLSFEYGEGEDDRTVAWSRKA
ncbi:MAG: tRNA (adenosine(37)-N6)-threonylcarbamoyltransferase complex ATPase subunit type 1 TsaE [Patescibacteria group bacterium]